MWECRPIYYIVPMHFIFPIIRACVIVRSMHFISEIKEHAMAHSCEFKFGDTVPDASFKIMFKDTDKPEAIFDSILARDEARSVYTAFIPSYCRYPRREYYFQFKVDDIFINSQLFKYNDEKNAYEVLESC